jgi:hypothetical protein
MMVRLPLCAGLALGLAACATTTPPAEDGLPERPPAGTCDAASAQALVGRRASGEAGAAILARSGARMLRWGPPRSAWTMDYREDRVNVRYDDAMTITEITCG